MLSASPAWDTGFANGVTNLNTGIEFGLQRASAALRTLRDRRGGWSLDGAHVGDPAEQTLHALTWARVAGLSTRSRPCQPRGSATLGGARRPAQAVWVGGGVECGGGHF